MKKKGTVAFCVGAFAFGLGQWSIPSASADEYYPKAVSTRFFGTDQGNVGDCSAEAQTMALESAFLNRGFSVRFSLFYRHAYNWVGNPEQWAKNLLNLNPADVDLIHRVGPLLPEYMWPEDTLGYRPDRTGFRPRPSDSAVVDARLPSANSFGYREDYYPFKSGYSNSSGLAGLKAKIREGAAIVLTMHGELLPGMSEAGGLYWDTTTGLAITPYSSEKLGVALAKSDLNFTNGLDHGVAVIGYDDTLYSDRGFSVAGALIIRNSWNNGSEFAAAGRTLSESQRVDFAKMRQRLSPINLPGFYAIPYQYILDLVQAGVGGFIVYGIDYPRYANVYALLRAGYETVTSPYVCAGPDSSDFPGTQMAKRSLADFSSEMSRALDTTLSESIRSSEYHHALSLVKAETSSRSLYNANAFFYARVARNAALGIDRAADLYRGAFNSYYCTTKDGSYPGSVWPGTDRYSRPRYQSALQKLSANSSAMMGWYEFFSAMAEAP